MINLCEQNCRKLHKTLILGVLGKFLTKCTPRKTIFEKNCQICLVSLYVSMSVKFHVKPMSILEDIRVLTMIQRPIFPNGTLVNGLWGDFPGATLPST